MSFYTKGQFDVQGAGNQPTTDDYSAGINPKTIMRDARFLDDLRDYYREKGEYFADDDQLVKLFYSDQTWGDLNTVSAISDAAEALSASPAQRERMRRIDSVWRQLPFFWQEGGRGMGAIGDIAGAILADPVNLIPGGKAFTTGVTATRAAAASGAARPVLEGVKKGTLNAAAIEAGISGAQEAVVNTAEQVRDIETGARQEFSGSDLAKSAGIGAAFGGTVGGLIGAPTALAGARQGAADIESMRSQGLSDEQIQNAMASFGARTDADTLVEKTREAERASEEAAEAERARAEAEQQAKDEETLAQNQKTYGGLGSFAEDIEGAQRQLDEALSVARREVDKARDQYRANPDEDNFANLTSAREVVRQYAEFREAVQRAKREAEDINALEAASNIPKNREEARERRAKFERDMENVRYVLRNLDGLSPEEFDNELKDILSGPEPKKTAPPAPDEAAAGGPAPDAPSGAAPEADAPGPDVPGAQAADETAEEATPPPRAEAEQPATEEPPVTEGVTETPRAEEPTVAEETVAETQAAPEPVVDTPAEESTIRFQKPEYEEQLRRIFDDSYTEADFNSDYADGVFKNYLGKKGQVTQKTLRAVRQRQQSLKDSAALREGIADPARVEAEAEAEAEAPGAEAAVRDERSLKVSNSLEKLATALDEAYSAKFGGTESYSPDKYVELVFRAIRNPAVLQKYGIDADLAEEMEALYSSRLSGDMFDLDPKEIKQFTKPERVAINAQARRYKADGLSDEAAQTLAESTILSKRGAPSSSSERSTQKSIDDASILTTAGKNPDGTIQGILKSGTRTGKGSDRTVTSGYQVRPNEWARDAAMMQARSGDGPDLVPYETTSKEKVIGMNGQTEVPAGTTVWADAVTGRAYESQDVALRARGDVPAQKPASSASDASPSSAMTAEETIDGLLNNVRGRKQGEEKDELDTLLDELLAQEPEDVRLSADETPELKPSPPLTKGDKKLIIRSRLDPDEIRIIGPRQIAEGKDIYAIIGQKGGPDSDPLNWEIRYAPMEANPRTAKAKKDLFESLPEEEYPMGSGARYNAGNATSIGDPLRLEEVDQVVISLESPDDLNAVNAAIDLYNKIHSSSAPKLSAGEEIAFRDIRALTTNMEGESWPKDREGLLNIIRTLEGLYAIQRRAAPQGYVLPNSQRKDILEKLDVTLDGYTAEELNTARRLLGDLGGDKSVAPTIQSEGLRNYYKPADTREQKGVSAPVPFGNYVQVDPKSDNPFSRVGALYHEVGHWAYENILTPEDRLEFWRFMGEYYDGPGADAPLALSRVQDRLPAYDGMPYAYGNLKGGNMDHSPQEFFANQFSMWAMQKHSDVSIREETFWRKVTGFVKAIFDRYFAKERIDPNLEPLFAKIIPDDVQQKRFVLGVDSAPNTPEGKILHGRFTQLQMLQDDIKQAFASDSAEGIIGAFQELKLYILSAAVNNKGSGPLLALRGRKGKPNTVLKILNEKFKAIDEILGGKPSELISIDDPASAGRYMEGGDLSGLRDIGDPQEIADNLRDFYFNGYAGKWRPQDGIPKQITQASIDKGYSSVEHMIDSVFDALSAGYQRAEGKTTLPPDSKPKTDSSPPRNEAGVASPSGTKRKTKAESQKQDERVEAQASADSKKSKGKRASSTGENKPAVDSSAAESPKTLSKKDLYKAYKSHRGTDYGDQLGKEITDRIKAKPAVGKVVPVSRSFVDMGGKDLEQAFLDALYDGNQKDVLDMALSEITRRANNKAAKKGNATLIQVSIKKMQSFISREIGDNTGITSVDGVPPSARASIRENLTFLTHRDPEVQTSLRTMAYRLYNLIGATSRGTKEESNILLSADMARLSGRDDSLAGDGAFGDYKSEEFNDFRKQVRRISAALNKGEDGPEGAMGDLMHMVVRSGALEPKESDAIVEAYRALDSGKRKRIEALIGRKYADRGDYAREQGIANEWFADAVNRYTREDMARADILDNVISGDAGNVRMRATLDRAIDRTIEYTAYVVNGQIGRPDVKQRYRRLTFYGDMFVTAKTRPMSGSIDGVLTHPSYAADHAADVINSASEARAVNMMNYTKGGVGFDEAAGAPVVFYHGTPKGYVFRRTESNPNAVFRSSQGGQYGPGYYLTANPSVASEIYSRRPTSEALAQQIEEMNISTAEKEAMQWDVWDLGDTRKKLSQLRREYAYLEDSLGSNPDVTSNTLESYKIVIDDLVEAEQSLAESLAQKGLKIDPYVMPMLIQLRRPADFRLSARYGINDPMVKAIMGRINEVGNYSERTFNHLFNRLSDREIGGPELYEELVTSLMHSGRNRGAAQEELTGFLEDIGHDGMLTTHSNTMGGKDVMGEPDSYRASSVTHTTAVLFSPEQAKHIEADHFDVNDDRVFAMDPPQVGMPRGVTGDVTTALMNDDISSLKDIPVGQFGELLEQEGANSTMTGAVMSLLRGRTPNAEQQAEIQKNGVFKYFLRSSQRMKNLGMNWLGDKYEGHFPDMNQRFGKKIMPVFKALSELPDSDGMLRGHFRRVTGSLKQEQPKSHSRIVRALRYGDGSRQERALNTKERAIYKQIRLNFRNELDALRGEGFHVGDRGVNYLPHVWSKQKILKNREDFMEKMRLYFIREKGAFGAQYTDDEVQAFAEGMMLRLTDEAEDGVYIPVKGTTKNSSFENVDYSRIIELEKYPDMLKELEPYLESNLESLLTKYFEGSSRRITSSKRFGVNSHAVTDYLKVANEGKQGIVSLLTTNKQFEYDISAMNPDGMRETATLVDTIRMPYQQNPGEASQFVDNLMAAHQNSGSSAARQMLTDIAPLDSSGNPSSVYMKRVDAIVGALDDFKGKTGSVDTDEGINYVENAMRVLMKKPLPGTTKGGMKASRFLRGFNNITLLGFTTLTSLGDLGLPMIRSPSFKSWVKGVAKWSSDPEYRDMIRNVGVAMENILHERMVHMYGAPDNKLSHAFFNATLLTPWTDMNREIAGATGYEAIRAMHAKARKSFKQGVPYAQQPAEYKIAHRFMRNYGLSEFLPGANRANEVIDPRLMAEDDTVRMAVIKFADDAIFQPNPNDVPLWAQTPIGSLVFQLKSFPLMMSRFSSHILREANRGNFEPLIELASVGPAFGMATLATKDIIQQRGGDDERSAELRKRNIYKLMGYDEKIHGNENDFLGWYVEGLMVMGGLGLLGDVIHSTVSQVDNGAYGQLRIWGTVLGPSFGLGGAIQQGAAAILDDSDNSNAKERSGMRELATRVPILGGNRAFREGLVDATAGEASSGSSGGWQSSWTRSN